MNMRIAVFASGRGSNLLAIHDAVISGKLEGVSLDLAVCDRPDAPVVGLVHKRNIPDLFFVPKIMQTKMHLKQSLRKSSLKQKLSLLFWQVICVW